MAVNSSPKNRCRARSQDAKHARTDQDSADLHGVSSEMVSPTRLRLLVAGRVALSKVHFARTEQRLCCGFRDRDPIHAQRAAQRAGSVCAFPAVHAQSAGYRAQHREFFLCRFPRDHVVQLGAQRYAGARARATASRGLGRSAELRRMGRGVRICVLGGVALSLEAEYEQTVERSFLLDAVQRRRSRRSAVDTCATLLVLHRVSAGVVAGARLRSFDVAGPDAFGTDLSIHPVLASVVSLGAPFSLYAV